MADHWQIDLLGGLRVRRGERTLPPVTPRNAAALLAFLACFPDRPHSRDELADLLWPHADPRRARANLSGELYRLRRHLAPAALPSGSAPPLHADAQRLWLDPAATASDVAAFRAASRAASRLPDGEAAVAALTAVVEPYRGSLLPGLCEEWVVRERERLAQAYSLALCRLLRQLEGMEAWEAAIEQARRAAGIDPLREEVQRELIRVLGAAGYPEAALAQYRALERLLRTAPGDAAYAAWAEGATAPLEAVIDDAIEWATAGASPVP
jgi:DNA-binding SARP family transcriptional activator